MLTEGSDKCPICEMNYERYNRLGTRDAYRVTCPRCGTYDISGTALVTMKGEHTDLLPYLSAHTRQSFEFGGRIVPLSSTWPALAEAHKHTSVQQRAEKLLRVIESRTRQPGEYVNVNLDLDYPLVDALDKEGLRFFLQHLRDLGCIDTGPKYINNVRLTVKGWDRLEVVRENQRMTDTAAATSATTEEPRGGQHPKAFVSHSMQDRSFVEQLAKDLRTSGVDTWYSGWEIKPGDSLRAKIEQGMGGCEFFIIILSKDSISRPWVQTELDAATTGKILGKVRKIIPVKIEDCGDLPPTLASLCWEDFSNQPYEAALKRVLDSIFERDIRPPLGAPPRAGGAVPTTPPAGEHDRKDQQLPQDVGEDSLGMEGLEGIDSLILEAACRAEISTGLPGVAVDSILPPLREKGISEDEIIESQEVLQGRGYLKLHYTIGHHPQHMTVEPLGFELYARARIPDFQTLLDEVKWRIAREEQMDNRALANALGRQIRIITHILTVLESEGWVETERPYGYGYHHVDVVSVSPELKRWAKKR